MRKLFYATVAFIAFLIGLFLFMFASFTSCISNNELTPPEMSVDVNEITLSTLWVDVDWPPSVHKINVYVQGRFLLNLKMRKSQGCLPTGRLLECVLVLQILLFRET